MKKNIALIAVLLSSMTLNFAQEKKPVKEIAQVVTYINKKDSAALLQMMADSCRIGNLPPMDNTKVLPEILSNLNRILDYEVMQDVVQQDGTRLISLAVTYQDGKSGKPTFLFNKDSKLVNLGVIKARMRGNPEKALADAVYAAIKPDTLSIQFELLNGLIYVPAKLNGQAGYFMFDSGCPVLILRKAFVAAEHINKDVSVDFTGMGGMMQDVQWATSNTLEWGSLKLSDLDAPVTSMDGMELENGVPIFGLMGYGILDGYQITFDYNKQELLLERVDDQGELIGASFNKGRLASSVSIHMKRHIPIVDITVGDTSYPMGIDCGANANVLKMKTAEALTSFLDYEDEQVAIAGVGGSAKNNKVGFLMHSKVGELPLEDMYTAVTDQPIGGGQGDDALPIEGLLGTPFLMQYKMTLNFNKGEISFFH